MDDQAIPLPQDENPVPPHSEEPAGERQAPSPPPSAAPTFQPAPPKRARFGWGTFLGGTVAGCGCMAFLALVMLPAIIGGAMGGSSALGSTRGSVGLVDVSGAITSGSVERSPFGAGGADAQSIVDQLEKARRNRRIKAVVMWINSPGGSAAASDAVYTEVRKVRASGKKVVVAMGDVAASGGYYIASAADRIYANGATITGSIGVISELPQYTNPDTWVRKSGLMDAVVIKSGKYKDMGNPMRPMTSDERAMFQQMVNEIYAQFLTSVSEARHIPIAKLRPLADGRVFTGRQAVKNGLVDEIGNLRDAISYAGTRSGLGPDPAVQKLSTSSLAQFLTGADADSKAAYTRKMLGLLLMDPRLAGLEMR